MNLLECCLSPDFGGLEIFFRDYVRWLATRDSFRLHLCVQTGSRLARELAPLGLPAIEFPSTCGPVPIQMSRRLARYLDKQQIDSLHCHWKNDLPMVALAKSLTRRRVRVIHSRHMDLPGPKYDPYHWYIYRSIDVFHAVTRAVALQAIEHLPIPRSRIRQVYLGAAAVSHSSGASRTALRTQLGLADRFTVGVVGRISEYKGQHLLVDAIWQLKDRGIEVQGVIAGHAMEADYLDSLRHRVQEAGLDGQVVFFGFQEDPHALLTALDVLALTTVKETFGLVLVEAMLLGVPVIGSNAGGVPEIIQHNQSGLLFESGNSTELAKAIETLRSDDQLRSRLSASGQARAQREFDRDAQYAKLLDLIRNESAD